MHRGIFLTSSITLTSGNVHNRYLLTSDCHFAVGRHGKRAVGSEKLKEETKALPAESPPAKDELEEERVSSLPIHSAPTMQMHINNMLRIYLGITFDCILQCTHGDFICTSDTVFSRK